MLILRRKEGESVIVKIRQDNLIKMLKTAGYQEHRSTMRIMIDQCIDELQKEWQIKVVVMHTTSIAAKIGFEAPPNIEIVREELIDQQKEGEKSGM